MRYKNLKLRRRPGIESLERRVYLTAAQTLELVAPLEMVAAEELPAAGFASISEHLATPAKVVGRHIFYNNSVFDGRDGLPNAVDDAAIAPAPQHASDPFLGKSPLRPGQQASFQNYTSFFGGINGIMVDVQDLTNPAAISADDFEFRVGNSDDVTTWSLAPTPTHVAVRMGAGVDGSDRITIIWPDKAIQKQWLQVVLNPTPNTGLAAADVHYWGNAVGDTGNSTADAAVNFIDFSATIANPHTTPPATIDDAYDHNRDRQVNFIDASIVLGNGAVADALRMISPPADIDWGVVSHWEFDGDWLDTAWSGEVADDALEQGQTAFLLGGLGTHALHSRGGDGNGLQIPTSSDINSQPLHEYSISLWFHTREHSTGKQLLYHQGGPQEGLVLYLVDGQLHAGAWQDGSVWDATWLSAATKEHAWNHVALTLDGTNNELKLFVNGGLTDLGFADSLPAHGEASIAGSQQAVRHWDPGSGQVQLAALDSFLGWLDDVRVYRRVLQSADVEALAAGSPGKVVADLPIADRVPQPSYQLPTQGTTYHVPASMSSAGLQQILDNLQGHDVVVLDKDGSWESIVLRNTTPGPKYIISSHMDSLPAFGERVDPSYAPWMPTIRTQTVDGPPLLPALNSEIGASEYHIAGVRFLKPTIAGSNSGVDGDHNHSTIVMLNRVPVGGSNSTLPPLSTAVLGEEATSYEPLGGNIVFDRTIFEGDDIRTTNGLLLSAKDTAVVGSYFHKIINRQIRDPGGQILRPPMESHGVEIVDSPGRILLQNNYLSVAGIGVMHGNNGEQTTDANPTGGQLPGLIPPMEDIVIRNNFFTKDLAWVSEIEAVTGTAAIKNAIETKGSNRSLWEGNFIENILQGNQHHGLVVKVSDGQRTDNVTIRNNTIRNATGAISLSNHVDMREAGNPSLRVGQVTVYGNDVEVGDMPPAPVDSFPIVRVSVDDVPAAANPIERVVFFENQLRRQVYREPEENGFAFINNQLQQIGDLSFVDNQLDCGEFGGFVGTGLGTDFGAVLDNFTNRTHMEDNVFLGCDPSNNIPPGNATFSASISIDAEITADDIISPSEAAGLVTVTGRVAGDAQPGDTITLRVHGNTYTGVAVDQGGMLTFAIDVPGSDLVADEDRTIDATLQTSDTAGTTIAPTDQEGYIVEGQNQLTISIDVIAGDDVIDVSEATTPITISGNTNATPGQLVTVALNGREYLTTVVAQSWTIDVPATDVQQLDATETVTATVSDGAGNIAQASRPVARQLPSPEAGVQIISDLNNDGFLNAAELGPVVEVLVTLPPEALVGDQVTIVAGSLQSLVLDAAAISLGSVSTTLNSPPEGGTLAVTVFFTDGDGNVSQNYSDRVTVDSVPPVASLSIDAITGDNFVDSLEAASQVTLTGILQSGANTNATVLATVNSVQTQGTLAKLGGVSLFSVIIPGSQLVSDANFTVDVTATVFDWAGNTTLVTAQQSYALGASPVFAAIHAGNRNRGIPVIAMASLESSETPPAGEQLDLDEKPLKRQRQGRSLDTLEDPASRRHRLSATQVQL